LFKTKNIQNEWMSMGLFTDTYLNHLKEFCHQCLISLKIEGGLCEDKSKEIKTKSIVKLVYSPLSDVIYVYMNDLFTSNILMETLNHWLINCDPTYKGTTLDTSVEGVFIIELNYQDKEVIKHNQENKLKLIVV
tara:strand:+ start:3162 stop:3563 length:402 start_codon:yes stop_codon:yes gene_type:complete